MPQRPSAPFVAYEPARLEAAARALGLRMVVLFGSRASGSPPPGPESDVDLAVLGHPAQPPAWIDAYRAFESVFPDLSLDLVLLHEADPLFLYEIFRSGVLLYGDPDAYYEYKAYAYRAFVESADLRALEEALYRKKMAYLRAQLHGAS